MTVRTSEDGVRALEAMRRARPDLVLLDLMMPGMDGFQLMEELQKDEDLRRIPVVVLTAMELTPQVRERLSLSQIHRIIRKGTYSRNELIEVVRRYALQNAGESVQGLA